MSKHADLYVPRRMTKLNVAPYRMMVLPKYAITTHFTLEI